MKLLRYLLALALVGVAAQCYAGFLTGVIVGSALSGNPKAKPNGVAGVIQSDQPGHDTIGCRLIATNHCFIQYERDATPEEFARRSGYSKVHSKAIGFAPDGTAYIFMEVSK